MTSEDLSRRVWEAMPKEIRDFWDDQARRRDGEARHVVWECEDGWLVGYTTERVRGGGELDGRFAALAWRPIGKGSRGGRRMAQSWKMVYRRAYAKRKTARARAEVLYYRHSPRIAARRGRTP